MPSRRAARGNGNGDGARSGSGHGTGSPPSGAGEGGSSGRAARGKGRIASLDQFRGYTVVAMILVNFLGNYHDDRPGLPDLPAVNAEQWFWDKLDAVGAIPAILAHHNTYCSYADTIMPQFFLAVGFALRLGFRKRGGSGRATLHMIARALALILVGIMIYGLDVRFDSWSALRAEGLLGLLRDGFQRRPFQALVHIGVTTLYVLPVLNASATVRLIYLGVSIALYTGLSYAFYYDWVMARPGIDGGPLGFLSWSIPVLVGTLAFDAMEGKGKDGLGVAALGFWAVVLMLLGYAASCLGSVFPEAIRGEPFRFQPAAPPFVPPDGPVNLWTMSQRAGSVSYHLFAAGFALAVLAVFVVLSDILGLQVGIFRSFGKNALAAYVAHILIQDSLAPFVPDDSPLWYVLAAFGAILLINWLFVRHLERKEIVLTV